MNVKLLTRAEMLNGKYLLDRSELCLKAACRNSYPTNMTSEKQTKASKADVEKHICSHKKKEKEQVLD